MALGNNGGRPMTGPPRTLHKEIGHVFISIDFAFGGANLAAARSSA